MSRGVPSTARPPAAWASGEASASLHRHLGLSWALAAAITLPLVIAARPPDPALGGLLGVLFFLLNLHIVESALVELAGRIPPRLLPGRSFPSGIPPSERTAVVYPILLRTPTEIGFVEENLRPSITANLEPNIVWVLLSGSPEPWMMRWEESCVRRLQRQYGTDRVVYLHRDPSLRNWERKRGAYLHLMHWIVAGAPASARVPLEADFPAMPAGRVFDRIVGMPAALRGVANLLIADSDTRWGPGSVRRLVGKIAHPTNHEYTIFQGRVAPHNPHGSVFSALQHTLYELFRDRHGSDWTVYGRINFSGHGAGWNIRRFLRGIAGRMADGYLSHDIVESYFLKTAFVADVETTEEVQETVENMIRQWRRWWTGNRIASLRLLGPTRPDEDGRRVPNRNFVGKLLLLHADRNYVMPVVLGAYLLVSGVVIWLESASLWLSWIGAVYFGLVMLRFWLPLVVRITDRRSARKIGFAVLFLTALVHVLMVEKARIVLADAAHQLVGALGLRSGAPEWTVQSSLAKHRGFRRVLTRTWGYPTAAIGLGAAFIGPADVSSPLLPALATVLLAAPIVVWYGAQRPPAWLLADSGELGARRHPEIVGEPAPGLARLRGRAVPSAGAGRPGSLPHPRRWADNRS